MEWKNAAGSVTVQHVCHLFILPLRPLQEYTLAHIDKPDTLAGAEKALKKHEDFLSTMEANEDKIDGALHSGQRLVDSGNLYSAKVQDKMSSISDRSVLFFVFFLSQSDFNLVLTNSLFTC